MKTCVSSYSFSNHIKQSGCDLFAVADMAKEMGFEAIEFTELPGEDKLALAKDLRAHCERLGLAVAAYLIGADFIEN